jgi:tetratricopeptide (TPR) repeat protein
MARRPANATLVVIGHSSSSTLGDGGEFDFGFTPSETAELVSELRFKSDLGSFAPRSSDERNHSIAQVVHHSGLTDKQIKALALYDVLDPIENFFSYRDLVAARAIGRLVSSGAAFGKVVTAALTLEQHGLSLATARLSESAWGEILQELEGRQAGFDGQWLLPLRGDDIDAYEAFARAEVSEQEGELDSAVRWYELAARLDQRDPVVPYNLGNVLDSLGRSREAEIAYRQAIGRSADFADAWFNLGVIQEKVGRADEALVSYEQAIVAEPTYADALFNSAALLMRMKRFHQALLLWEQIAKNSAASAAEAKRLAHLCRFEIARASAR